MTSWRTASEAGTAPFGARLLGACKQLGLLQYFAILLQFALFLLVLYRFNLESQAFLNLGIFALLGWSIHYFLPERLRLPFFVVLSLAGIEFVFGFQSGQLSVDGLIAGAWIILIVLGFIGIWHLPIRVSLRVALLVAVGAALAGARAGLFPVPWSSAIWPIAASMVMFRMIVYAYQVRHDKKPVSIWHTLAYFFMLPNVCFPLFPVVDFQTFRRSHYSQEDRHRTYQTGIHWLFRGAFHLLCYRLIYHNFVIDADEVTSVGELLQYLLWPMLLYLRISGSFHIIVGLLLLFGFNLPETNKLYFLASSFNDFWRRINIYWKDFMMNVFYYPTYFKLRKYGDVTALVISTLFAFFMTWFLHSYQNFWILGHWLFVWNDGLYWAILALLVVANSLYETKRGRRRRLSGDALSWRDTLVTALRTIAVFSTLAVLWSFWSANSIAEWLSTWRVIGESSALASGTIWAVLALVLAIGGSAVLLARGVVDTSFNFTRSAAAITAVAVLMLAVSVPQIYRPFGPDVRQALNSLRSSDLNRRDFANLERGYYENLLDVGGFNPELLQTYQGRPADWGWVAQSDGVRHIRGVPGYELRPSYTFQNKGVTVRTNQWGMRDQDYERTPPPNTLRITLIGASHTFGSGVENDETFEARLEERLNSEAAGGPFDRYEILNFALGGYSSIENLALIEHKVPQFEPDVIFYVDHTDAAPINRMVKFLTEGIELPYDFLNEVIREAGIEDAKADLSADKRVLANQLKPYREKIIEQIYHRMAAVAKAQGLPVVWIYLPSADEIDRKGPPETQLRLAREAGFHIVDLTEVYDGHEPSTLWVARWDHHPNALGHQLIADMMFEELQGLDFKSPALLN